LTKRRIALFLVMALVTFAFAGCAGNAAAEEQTGEATTTEEAVVTEVEQTLVWNLGSDPKTIDPGLNGATDGGHITNNMFEGLMREIDGKYEPGMAESYTVSEDGLTYTFVIREDAMWSDGQALTANDFEYAWSRVVNPETASEYAWIFDAANVDSWTAVDEKTFEVKLSSPTPYFVGLTAFYTFFPVREDMVAASEEGSWASNPETAVSNGPFKLTSFKTGDRLILEPNEFYWKKDEVKLTKIEVLMIVDQATALTGFESGQIQVLDDMPSAEIPRLLAEDPSFMILPKDATYYYSFNLSVKPLDDVMVRKALSLAIDRQAIVETVTKAGQVPAHSLIPSGHLDANGDVFNQVSGNYDIEPMAKVEEARALLAEAGYPNGEGFPTFEIMYNTSEGHKNIAEAIQEMWKQNLGINVTLANQEWAVFQDTRRQGNYEICISGWVGDYSDPTTYLGMFVTGNSNNYPGWSNEAYDALLETSKSAKGQERFEMLYEADKLLSERYVVMPVYYYTDPQMIGETVAGWEKTTRGTFYFGRSEMVSAE